MKLEELNIYKSADMISDKIWGIVEEWDYYRKDTLGKQLVRAADSISANIAEGYGRYFFKENRNFCYYSRGSLLETKNWLGKAYRRNLIKSDFYFSMIKELEDLHKSLNGYIKYITDQSKIQKD
ncbi:four helix bundle protein [Roseivirga sp.]|uniref:four helix bundle protein n=1 Tax=Roseivirga sp. TaxID=1964215 RepID=UPI003B51B314